MKRWVWLAAGVVIGAVAVNIAGVVIINRYLDRVDRELGIAQ